MNNKICKYCGKKFTNYNKKIFCTEKCTTGFHNRERKRRAPNVKKAFLIGGKMMVMRPQDLEAVIAAEVVITKKVGSSYIVLGFNKPRKPNKKASVK